MNGFGLSESGRGAAYEAELATLPIGQIDVAQPRLFQLGLDPCCFERLRREAPVHHCTDGFFGSYWSITRYDDVERVELGTAPSHRTISTAA